MMETNEGARLGRIVVSAGKESICRLLLRGTVVSMRRGGCKNASGDANHEMDVG